MDMLLREGTSWPTCTNRTGNGIMGTSHRLASVGRRKTPDGHARTQFLKYSSKIVAHSFTCIYYNTTQALLGRRPMRGWVALHIFYLAAARSDRDTD